MRDLSSNISALSAIACGTYSDDVTGEIIDLRGMRAAVFVLQVGDGSAIEAGCNTAIQESDDGVEWSYVSREDYQDARPAIWGYPDQSTDPEDVERWMLFMSQGMSAGLGPSPTWRIGYNGWKRYVRLKIERAATTPLTLGAFALVEPLARPAP